MDKAEAERIIRTQAARVDPTFWAERYFYIEDRRDLRTGDDLGAGPIILAPHQKRIIRAALERKGSEFRWSTIVYSAPKKSGKTRVAAMIAAWLAWYSGAYSEIYCLANDGKQSTDRVLAAVKKAVKLSPLLADWHDIKTRVNLPSGAFIEAVPVDPTGEAGAQPTGSFWCFDEETEILTQEGWKSYKTADQWDKYATLSSDGCFEWQFCQDISKTWYEGPMWGADTKRVSLLVTPSHRIIGRFVNKSGTKAAERASVEVRSAADASKFGFVRPVVATHDWKSGFWNESFRIPGTKRKNPLVLPMREWVQFLAWYLSEGCVLYGRKRRPEGVLIAQCRKKMTNRIEIKELCEKLGWNPRSRKSGAGFEIWDVRLANHCTQFGKAHEKWIPSWLKEMPKDILEMFLQTYRKGDGWDHGRGFDIGTASKAMADDLMEIGQKCGYYISYGAYADKRSKHLQRKIRFRPGHTRTPVIMRKHWRRVDYKGIVWCPSTPNGVVLVRRNGTCYWSGNSEMWGFRLTAKERLWTEFTIPPTKFGHAIRYVESYAGFIGESPILEQLYDQGVNRAVRHPDFPDLPVYINERARLFCYWDHEPRMIWQTPEYYAAEAALLTDNEFQRIHRNMWVTSEAQAIPIERWDACRDKSLPPVGPNAQLVIGVDLSVSGDYTALVVASLHPANHDIVAIRGVQVWVPPKGQKIDYTQGIMPALAWWCNTHDVVCVTYDEYQAHLMATELKRELGVWFKPFPQGKGTSINPGRPVADKMLFDRVMARTIAHNGDATLRQHVINAAAKGVDERWIRFVKKAEGLKIDALVAASMAVCTISRLNLG